MRASLLTVPILLLVVQLVAQQPTSQTPRGISGVLHEMKSPNLAEREEALNKACELLASHRTAPGDLDRLRVGIIQLLISETAILNAPDPTEEELERARKASGKGADSYEGDYGDAYDDDEGGDYSRYSLKLVATVAGFYDERAIPALVSAMPWGGDATKALLGFGDKALGPVTEKLKSRNYSMRTSALDMTIALLVARNDLASRVRIRELIETSMKDPDPAFRSYAVEQIVCLPHRQDFVPALEKVGKTDPWKLPGRAIDGGDGGQFYPVRAQVRRALRAIQSNESCQPRP